MQENETRTPEQPTPDTPVTETTDTTTEPLAPETGNEDPTVTSLLKQLEEAKSKLLYLASDFDNFRRHAAKEKLEMKQMAGQEILMALLPLLDDFDRAAKNGALTEGTTLIHQKMVNTLKSKGLTLLELQAGDAFNPDQHEAVAEIPAASEELKGKIVDVLEPAYSLGNRIIRYAKVVVGR